MDGAAKKFKSVSAKLHQISYNHVLNESTSEDGELRLRHGKNGLTGVLEFNPPDQRMVGFVGNQVKDYHPKAKQVTVLDAGKGNMAKIDQFLLIAFGATSGSELKNAYDIQVAGTENIDSKPTTHLILTPKSEDAKKLATMIELWFPSGDSKAVKEKVTQPTKDYIETTYSHVESPSPLPDSAFELKLPSDVHVIKQK